MYLIKYPLAELTANLKKLISRSKCEKKTSYLQSIGTPVGLLANDHFLMKTHSIWKQI